MSNSRQWRLAVLAAALTIWPGIACSGAPQGQPSGPTGDGNDPGTFTFVHLGDVQIGFGRDGILADRDRLLRAIDQINALKVDFVYLAGDLTHKETSEEYALLEAALKRFEPRLVVAPGNHDVKNHQALAAFRTRWGKDYCAFTHRGCEFVVVDSLLLSEKGAWFKERNEAFLREVQAQWAWLEKALADAQKAGRAHIFLLMHVPPFLKSETEGDRYENLPAAARKRMMELARRHGVRAILCGHDHTNSEIRSEAGPTIWISGGTARVGKGEQFGFHVWTVRGRDACCEFVQLAPAPATQPAGK